MTSYEPLVGGLRLGGLVEVFGLSKQEEAAFAQPVNGELGQVIGYTGGDVNKFSVHLANGVSGHFSPKNVRAVLSSKKPGEGGSPHSFDLLLAPRTEAGAIGQEMSRCMLEKGFCVLKHSQNCKEAVDGTVKKLREAAANGNLARLPEECEAGYLGKGCKGKVVWMDPDNAELACEETLVRCDRNLSFLAQVFHPYSYDLMDDYVDERTSALICLSLTGEEEPDYPFPEPDDATLGVFLQTWRRTLVRAIHFLGPGTAKIELTAREGSKAPLLPHIQRSISLKAAPNTILLYRADTYDYKCDAPEETLMMITNFLSRGQKYEVLSVEGNTSWLQRDGPPPPGDRALHIVNTTVRLPAGMDSDLAYDLSLVAGTDAAVQIPVLRWDVSEYYSERDDLFQVDQTTTKHQSLVEGAELFDNRHFEISNAEAKGMDPVQRLVLEAGAQSMAMVGLTKKVANRKAIYAGFAVGNDKLDWMTCDKQAGLAPYTGSTSTSLAVVANRFSFVFNLKGPNFVCDSSCSASLCSTHCAKLMMLDQKFDPLDFFISMGAQMCLSPGPFIVCSQAHMTSPQGRSFTFNQTANGYLRGEGISGLMLKYANVQGPSEAMLRASQVGQDGRSASLTAPNGPAQEELIRRTIREAEMEPLESMAWECHGTGVSLGDPIEIGAIRKVHLGTQRSDALLLASNKSNIGHLEGGSAMCSMCKCILQCRYTTAFPTLHVRELNAHMEHTSFDALYATYAVGFGHVQGHSQVSSFGHGGTNGHMVFWGENHDAKPDIRKLWVKKVSTRQPPEVRPMGSNPDDWEADFPDTRGLRDNTKYNITMSPDDPADEPVKFELKEQGPDLDVEDVGHYFSISGNFNSWGQESMTVADVPGLFTFSVKVPVSGTVEWRFLQDGNTEEVIAPETTPCTKKSEAIVGPKKGLKNKWVVYEDPGREVTIEFFCKRGMRSVLWLVKKD